MEDSVEKPAAVLDALEAPALEGGLVVVDTNLLDSTSLLRDPVSLSLLFHMRQRRMTLGLSEVVVGEWRRHFCERFAKAVDQANQNLRWLHSLDSSFRAVESADIQTRAEAIFEARLTELGDLAERLPISADHWQLAGQMVLAVERPSSAKDQQLKDSLIWRAVLDAARDGRRCVVLATRDKGFLDSDQPRLADNLYRQAQACGAEIYVVSDLKVILNELSSGNAVVVILMVQSHELAAAAEFMANDALSSDRLIIARTERLEMDAYATADADELAVSISATYTLAPLDQDEVLADAELELEASALISPVNEEIVDFFMKSLVTTFFTPHSDVSREKRWSGAPVPDERLRLAGFRFL